jgi:hypothetical protein
VAVKKIKGPCWMGNHTVLAIINNWHMRQLDFAMTFPQADIELELYMNLPAGFSMTNFMFMQVGTAHSKQSPEYHLLLSAHPSTELH